jgi:serine/threonine-protein kinase RIO1
MTKENSDLFEIIEMLPLDIQNVLSQFEREGYDYQTCTKYLAILESKGYTFEYNLDGTPFNLTETK